MKKKTLLISLSTTLLLGGCAGMSKMDRLGLNDGSDPCFIYLDRLDDTAIYYKDQRMTEIAAGVLIGGGTGALLGMAAGRTDAATIIGGLAGAITGGFAADAYWKNKLQNANNQTELAFSAMEADVKQDIDKLSSVDKDIAALLRCRTDKRDMIKKQFAERKLTLQQAQQEWKKWGALIRKDREEMKYLNEALDSIKKIEDSYDFAATAIESSLVVSEDMQRKWQQELHIEEENELANVEFAYKAQLLKKRINAREKKKIKHAHKQKIADIKKHYASKEASIKTKVNPKVSLAKGMVSSFHEKRESIQKNKAQIDNMAVEAGDDNGFVSINSRLSPIYKNAEVLAKTNSMDGVFLSSRFN